MATRARRPTRRVPAEGVRDSLGARQEQVCQVRAGDEQNEAHRGLKRPDRRSGVADNFVLQRVDAQPMFARVGSVEVFARPIHEKGLELGARRLERNSRREPADEVQVVVSPVLTVRGIDGNGNERLDRLRRETEPLGHHSRDGDLASVELDRFSHQGRVSPEDRPPELIGQYGDGGSPGKGLLETDRSSQERRHSERIEEVGGDPSRPDAPGTLSSSQIAFTRGVGAEDLKGAASLLELEELRR